jgi:adenylate cyclase
VRSGRIRFLAVNPLSPNEIAELAGVEPAYVGRLAELEILHPDDEGMLSEGDVQRVRVVQMLEHAGLPLDGLGEAIRRDLVSLDFLDIVSNDRWAGLSDVTYRDLSDRTGVPVELLTVIREAMGFAEPEPSDRMREDEMGVVPLVQLQHENGFRAAVVERALRVMGESMRRVAETESDWWREEIMMPIIDSGLGPAALSDASATLSPALSAAGDKALLAIYHGQQANSWIRNLLEGFETALESAGLHTPPQRVPAICFLDLTGYTRLTEERGDVAAAGLARSLASMVQQHSVRHGGTAVKWLGDGVMFHFPEPGKGVLAALDMVDAAPGLELPMAHVGLHAGPVLFQEGDYFGRTVNIAARIADYARPGEVVVSQEVIDASGSDTFEFSEIGPVELKGVSGTHHLHSARRKQVRI